SRSRDFLVALVSSIFRKIGQYRSNSVNQVNKLFVRCNVTTLIGSSPDSVKNTRTSTRELSLFESDGYIRAVISSSYFCWILKVRTINSDVCRSIVKHRSNVIIVCDRLNTLGAVSTFIGSHVSTDDDS